MDSTAPPAHEPTTPAELRFERASMYVRRLHPRTVAVGALPAALGACVWLFGFPMALAPYAKVLLVLGALASTAFFRRRPITTEAAPVRADARGLHVKGALVLPRLEIARGYLQPGSVDGPALIRLESFRFLASRDVEVASRAEGEALLRALGVDVTHATVAFKLVTDRTAETGGFPLGMLVLLLGSLMFLFTRATGGFMALAYLGVLAAAGLGASRVATVAVGADGVLVQHGTQERFVPFAEIARAVVHRQQATLLLTSNERVVFRAPSRRDLATIDAFVERVKEGLASFRNGERADATSMVARCGRPVAAWLDALRAIPRGVATYRNAVVPAEMLWRIVEDPTADESARAGAAVALRIASIEEAPPSSKGRVRVASEDVRERLYAAARAAASPRVRVVLEKAAHAEEDEEIEEALAACER